MSTGWGWPPAAGTRPKHWAVAAQPWPCVCPQLHPQPPVPETAIEPARVLAAQSTPFLSWGSERSLQEEWPLRVPITQDTPIPAGMMRAPCVLSAPGVWSPVLRTHGIPPERGCSETHGAVQGAEEQSVTVWTHRFCSAIVGHGQGVTEVTKGCQGQRRGSEPLQWWVSPGAACAAGSAQVRNLAAWLCLWASAG